MWGLNSSQKFVGAKGNQSGMPVEQRPVGWYPMHSGQRMGGGFMRALPTQLEHARSSEKNKKPRGV